MEKVKVTNGVYWVQIPEADLFILCGCPADSVKHLAKMGLIVLKERNGVTFQTGPNAILLSDTTIQKGSFSNLAEFPVLQMLYLQGMILPRHPNNTGRKPMLIGLEDQVASQAAYIYRGTYGLATLLEIIESGVTEELAREMLRIKKWFAFDNIRRTEDLLDLRVVNRPAIELRAGAFVRRRGFNQYEFSYGGSSVKVDLNLADNDGYPATYQLGFHRIRREYFSIIHMGEGDGWDVQRPCMGSMICFQGKLYLVDAGPGIQHSLTALGISTAEIDGVFHTHAHDDHFAGLTSLVRSDHLLKYYATPPVRASVMKKYAALTGRSEASFSQFFEIHDLTFDTWNPIDGLEVMPVFSPHPVETSVLFFRALWEGGYKSYAHLADLSSFDVLKRMVTADRDKSGISQAFYDAFTKRVLQPADVKKIDIGGGLIHGNAEDFRGDTSGRIVLAHTSEPLTDAQKEVGSGVSFADEDVLIPTQCDSLLTAGHGYLQAYFPGAPAHDVAMLANCPRASFNPNVIIIRAGAAAEEIYLLLSGTVELIDSSTGIHNVLSAGAILGELAVLRGEKSRHTLRAMSHTSAFRIPQAMYREFIRKNSLEQMLLQLAEGREFLQSSWLFGEMVPFPIQNMIAQTMTAKSVEEGKSLRAGDHELALLTEGLLTIFSGSLPIENLKPGDFFGEETLLGSATGIFEVRATLDSRLACIPAEVLKGIPIVQWKLRETLERRAKGFRTDFRLEWTPEYQVGIPSLDEQHKVLFETIDAMASGIEGKETPGGMASAIDSLITLTRAHFRMEESLIQQRDAPAIAGLANEHAETLKKIEGFRVFFEKAPATALRTMIEYLKDWVLDHVLLENRKYADLLKS